MVDFVSTIVAKRRVLPLFNATVAGRTSAAKDAQAATAAARVSEAAQAAAAATARHNEALQKVRDAPPRKGRLAALATAQADTAREEAQAAGRAVATAAAAAATAAANAKAARAVERPVGWLFCAEPWMG